MKPDEIREFAQMTVNQMKTASSPLNAAMTMQTVSMLLVAEQAAHTAEQTELLREFISLWKLMAGFPLPAPAPQAISEA